MIHAASRRGTQLGCGSASVLPRSSSFKVAIPRGSLAKAIRWALDNFGIDRTVGSPQTSVSAFFTCASGDSMKLATSLAAAGAVALNGMAKKWTLASVPP